MLKYYVTLLCTIFSLYSFAGAIKGKITDNKNNAPLTGVVVAIPGTDKGGISDIDGYYEISGLANGTYEIVFTYPSYTTYRQDIKIVSNNDVILDMKLLPETTELKENVVKATRITNSENAVISEIKSSSTIVSGTSASQISKSLDRNAADVVKRIPGVTIQDDRFIVIRGLPDRYNTVWLNDASTPSSEADKKAFSFDIIPAGLIDRVLIFKTPSPDLPGDFAGGMVKVYTTSIADKDQLSISLQTSSREYTTGTNMNYTAPSKTDWLGYDDGKRSIPSSIPDYLHKNDPNSTAQSKAFGNDWIIQNKNTRPDARVSLAWSKAWKFKKIKIGNTLGVSYANTFTNYQIKRQDWDSAQKSYFYSDKRSSNNVSAGFMENLGVTYGNSKIEFKNLYNQIGNSSVTVRQSVRDTSAPLTADERAYALAYESRATYSSQLTGTHKNKKDTRKYTWGLGYNDLFKNQPDLRRIKYSKQQSEPDSLYKAQIASTVDPLNGGGRLYSTLYEHTYSFNHQITQKFTIDSSYSFEVSAGNFVEYKDRSFRIRQMGYTINPGANAQTLKYLPIDQIFADTNVGGSTKFRMDENTNKYDRYSGQNELIASFVSVKLPVGKHITVFGGARYEYNIQSIQTFVNLDSIKPDIKTKFLLPSVNASYNFTDKSLLRLAYGKTLNRPEFREWAPIFFYDFDELAGNKGSLFKTTASRSKSANVGDTLKVAQIQNFDVRYELYPNSGELIQVGGFFKSFKDPIQRVIVPGSGSDSKAFTFINANSAYCYGLELDLRKNLFWLDSKFGTEFFKDVSIVGNLALAKSQLTIDSSQIVGAIPKSNLQGQSPYVVNAGAYYQSLKNGFQGSLLYNVFGPRMYAVGSTDPQGESIGELPFQSFDITISKLLHKHYIVNFGIQNLLGSRITFVKDINRDNKFDSKHDRDYTTYYPGRYYSIGVKFKF